MNKTQAFPQCVAEVVAQIPKGRVMTYGAVATIAGKPRAARAVGMCLSKNKDIQAVPCHRVVAANGALTGYAFGGVVAKRRLLLEEGVIFQGERVDLAKSGWIP